MRALPLLLLAAMPAAAQRAGEYAAQGSNPDGSTYAGMVELAHGPNGTWRITWRVGDQVVEGTGLEQDGVLAASYVLGASTGVVAWRVLPDGRLRGTWTVDGGVGTEVLTPRDAGSVR